ncbi:uncharacterized protein F5891DRAFT_1050412 [Suillus fuscotomentosus]|uniref:Transmembrane protein n=1 Tax=Suillus fuscotomentosus TaxID=1912939 RepID=A0AAD4E2I5_9AGAM|nr:uncharacterized protein F5891DRAFT_1050412 [Suillus fuscotomentosus]KAG1897108.1 hypothetical protein F5891DRAFT_1050412 [Suillus fuscotomentosus]
MADFHSTELGKKASAKEQPLPEALRSTSLVMRVLCFLALGCPNFDDHWKSLQSEQAFETVRTRLCDILGSTITMASILAISGVFVSTASPVSYFGYTSSIPYYSIFISLMFAIFAMLTSGSSMIRWLHTDRHWTQEQLKQGGYFVWSYLLSIVTPMFFVVWSLNCFVFAILIAGFSSQSVICRALTALGLVTYVVNVGKILIEAMRNYATSLEHAGCPQ